MLHKKYFFVLFVLLVAAFNFYFFSTYQVQTKELQAIKLGTSVKPEDVVIYLRTSHSNGIDFSKPILHSVEGDNLRFDVTGLPFRTFRIYFGREHETAIADSIQLIYKEGKRDLEFKELNFEWIQTKQRSKTSITFSNDLNGFLEYYKEGVSTFEFILCELLCVLLSAIASMVFVCGLPASLTLIFKRENFKQAGIVLFLISVFLPHPLFNVAFIVSFAMLLYKPDIKNIFASKVAILFMAYFTLFFFNNLFFSSPFNTMRIETYIPVLLIPLYFGIAPKTNYLRYFPVVALIIGMFLIIMASIDAFIHHQLIYFSFDAFTKYIHPVYLSYMLLFALIYIEMDLENEYDKRIFLPVIMATLIFCASKLIIVITILFYMIRWVKRKPVYVMALTVVFILMILFFGPIKKRFNDVMDLKSYSVLKENPIQNEHDKRLNGITLRLIIWQETVNSISGIKELLFGNGVDQRSDKELENSFKNRGLSLRHTHYDPHNQFLTSFYHMGFLGLGILLIICFYSLRTGIFHKDQLIIYASLLFIFAMITESVLERVTGIYFFCSLLILLVQKYTAHKE